MQPIYPPADLGGPPPSPPNRPGRGGLIAVVAAIALISAGLGTAVGAIVIKSTSSNAATVQPTNVAGAPATGDTHAQDVGLCTRYATINSAMPRKDKNAAELLPGVAALETSLQEFPGASPEIREAVAELVSVYYARMAGYAPVRARGLAEPRPHRAAEENAASERLWNICGLDQE
ncbi:hypothetical protein [Mycobacteroides abscessus]|uniref:hypothetical protein n=1 Tax=Mycobacteroides abscessus TaxID=36809 RepID=UPI00089DD1A3|nr:hypothetical protein [Mycobacteroides abscessus]SHT80807.1 Uncharacterised protein [Mycobacteroides abscessus subsp. abscessus]SHV83674.1 Uncharacterised protein [Mycobacteroides abscessus subsp. abscessus]SHW76480.1 Uncharacterised protein [Mycobacteroides abscessus subsp. abscessus]SHX45946.1 Uncharacterised protein [Mycobacteroides abscessus subsp. abscessus]SHZ71465.1 Uncharacterised protein [Mycobacteroides abscessus subsp. abscessus]